MSLPDPAVAELDAIDAALAGRPVDPMHAELAELALLLAAGAPSPHPEAAERLDARFAALAPTPAPRRSPRGRRPAYWAGLLAVPLCLAVLVLVLPGGGGSHGGSRSGAYAPASSAPSVTRSAAGGSAGSAASSSSAASSPALPAPAPADTMTSAASAGHGETLVPGPEQDPASGAAYLPPTPQPNGRAIVQSDQLTLAAADGQIPAVAEELFEAVGAEGGIVEHSQVSSGADGFASFTLSIPSANLAVTLARLTGLRDARVVSSSETATDVNGATLDDARVLRDAEARRASLLTQLREASTATATRTLRARLAATEASITQDTERVRQLSGRVAATTVTVQIEPAGGTPASPGHGLSIGRGAHDALAVLSVVGAVLLIAAAVLVPVGLLLGAGLWIGAERRRRARERTLDAA